MDSIIPVRRSKNSMYPRTSCSVVIPILTLVYMDSKCLLVPTVNMQLIHQPLTRMSQGSAELKLEENP